MSPKRVLSAFVIAASLVVASLPAFAAPFAVKVNFQHQDAETPAGYVADSGLEYGDKGNGFEYGWDADNLQQYSRERKNAASKDKRYDTLMHMQKDGDATWEIKIPNGKYKVFVVSGDPNNNDSVYKINVEGVLVVNGTPTAANKFVEGTATVEVKDGKLTVSCAEGSSNNKICFIDIDAVE